MIRVIYGVKYLRLDWIEMREAETKNRPTKWQLCSPFRFHSSDKGNSTSLNSDPKCEALAKCAILRALPRKRRPSITRLGMLHRGGTEKGTLFKCLVALALEH